LSSDVNELVDRVVEYSYDKGWRLREVRIEKSSLNAIFAELSKKIKK
jgi:ABC-2 type transport system ATP-binding protein